jgi:diaminopimelate decarboxylase
MMAAEKPVTLEDLQSVIAQSSPLLPQEELQVFVQHYFGLRDKYCSVLAKHPPPLYILESSVLRERASQFRKAFQQVLPEVSFYYAVKSNNHPDVARILLQSEFGLDVSSGLELEMALNLGARDMVFSGPGKTDQELCLATMHAETVIVLIDSFGELNRLEGIARSLDRAVRVGIRLTTETAGPWRKFGVEPNSLPAFWESLRQCAYLRLKGLQFHTSWNLSPKRQIEFIHALGSVLQGMPAPFRDVIEFIDIGGGYWPAQGEWLQAAGTPAGILRKALGKMAGPAEIHYRLPSVSIEAFAGELASEIRRHLLSILPCRICFEPGRWICNDAMHLFISVIDKKAPDLVITDAGTNAIGWERFETDYFPILNLTRPSLQERPCNILGSLCTPHDLWGYSYWGDDIQPGDLLMIPTQGAYTYSLRQGFIKPLPAVVTI